MSPKWVPQMADAAQVMAGIARRPGLRLSVLTPNMRGFEGALAAGADEIVIFGAATEAFSQRNINCSIADSIERFAPVARAAKDNDIRVRAAISVAFGCPYQGAVPVADIVDIVERFKDLGCDEIGIADTIGTGTANQVASVFEAAAQVFPLAQLSGHFHDTYGQGVANVLAALQVGVSHFDTSIAGLGGCPFAKGATGNVATEDVVYLLHGLGIETGLDLERLALAGQWISQHLGRKSNSRAGNGLAARIAARTEKQEAA